MDLKRTVILKEISSLGYGTVQVRVRVRVTVRVTVLVTVTRLRYSPGQGPWLELAAHLWSVVRSRSRSRSRSRLCLRVPTAWNVAWHAVKHAPYSDMQFLPLGSVLGLGFDR